MNKKEITNWKYLNTTHPKDKHKNYGNPFQNTLSRIFLTLLFKIFMHI
jgi:hypothetical protein